MERYTVGQCLFSKSDAHLIHLAVVLTTIPAIYANTYHQKTGIIGLHYIALVRSLSQFTHTVLNGP